MEMQGEKTFTTACTLYKLTSVGVNVTLEISCTVWKKFLWNSCTVCKISSWNTCTVCQTSLWKWWMKRHLQLPVHCIS